MCPKSVQIDVEMTDKDQMPKTANLPMTANYLD